MSVDASLRDEEVLLELSGATLGYGRRAVLEGIDFRVRRGAFVGIVGPNGSGKTTLLRGLLGLDRPLSGTLRRAGTPRGAVGPLRIGYVPQRARLDPLFPLAVRDLIGMGRYPHRGPLRRWRAEDDRAVVAAARRVAIEPLLDRPFRDLSGGQQQRALLARALATEPDLLVLDEPTNGMDLGSERALCEVVAELNRDRGTTVLFVTHLLHLVADAATHFALLTLDAAGASRSRLIEGDRTTILTPETLSATYGRRVRVHSVEGHTLIVAE